MKRTPLKNSSEQSGANLEGGFYLPPSIEGVKNPSLLPVVHQAKTKTGKRASLDEVKALAQQLNEVEMGQLLDFLAAQRLQLAAGRDVEAWAQAVYDALVRTLGHGGLGLPGPIPLRRLLATHSAWTPVEAWMEAHELDNLKVAERRSVYFLLARLLVERAQEIAQYGDLPLTPKLVANSTRDIAAIFDRAFPGYSSAGLVHIVVRRLVSGEGQLPA